MCRLSLLSHQDRSLRHSTLRMHLYCWCLGSHFDGNTSHSAALHTPQTTGGCQDWSYVSLTYKTRTPPRHRLLARYERRIIHILHLASGFINAMLQNIHTYNMPQTFSVSVFQYSETTFSLVILIMMIGILITELIYLITITCLITLTIY